MIAPQLLTHVVTLERLDRDAAGNLAVVATHAGLAAYVRPIEQVQLQGQAQESVARAAIYLMPWAPIDETHPDWQIWHRERLFRVLSIERVDDPRFALTDHFKVLTR